MCPAHRAMLRTVITVTVVLWTLLGLRESSVVSSLGDTSDLRKLCMLRTQGSVGALLEPNHFLDTSVSMYKVVHGKRTGLKKLEFFYFKHRHFYFYRYEGNITPFYLNILYFTQE